MKMSKKKIRAFLKEYFYRTKACNECIFYNQCEDSEYLSPKMCAQVAESEFLAKSKKENNE